MNDKPETDLKFRECSERQTEKKPGTALFWTNKRLTVCTYCGSNSKYVECAGMFHCNNLTCTGPGAAWFRYKLESYRENDRSSHEVDHDEWEREAKKHLKTPEGKNYTQFWVR